MNEQTVLQEIESFRLRAADYVYITGTQLPEDRFTDVDGTPENARVSLTPAELTTIVAGAMAAVAHGYEAARTQA